MKKQYGAENQQLRLNVNKSKDDVNKFYDSAWFPWVTGPLLGLIVGSVGGCGIKYLVDRKYVDNVNQLVKSSKEKDKFIKELNNCSPVKNVENVRVKYLQLLEDISNVRIDCDKVDKSGDFKFKITKEDNSVSLHDPNRILGEFSFRNYEFEGDDDEKAYDALQVTFPGTWGGIGAKFRYLKYGNYANNTLNGRKILSLLVLAYGLIDMRGDISFDTINGQESSLQKSSAYFQVANALYQRIWDKVKFGLKNF